MLNLHIERWRHLYRQDTHKTVKTPVLVEAENGDTRYSDWAQDEFDDECGIIEELLSDVGIFKEEL